MRAVESVWGTLGVQSWLVALSTGTDQHRAGAWMGRTKFKVKAPGLFSLGRMDEAERDGPTSS